MLIGGLNFPEKDVAHLYHDWIFALRAHFVDIMGFSGKTARLMSLSPTRGDLAEIIALERNKACFFNVF